MSAQSNPIEERIGSAWQNHREGRNDAAISAFEEILRKDPDNIDANYGIGLALKADGQMDKALTAFEKALSLTEDARTTYEKSRAQEHPDDNVKTPEDDRFMMLNRMIKQRIEESKQAAP